VDNINLHAEEQWIKMGKKVIGGLWWSGQSWDDTIDWMRNEGKRFREKSIMKNKL
jgi:hypothetical protein